MTRDEAERRRWDFLDSLPKIPEDKSEKRQGGKKRA
jgi:hypothetical protein